jgi:hypothetical protein
MVNLHPPYKDPNGRKVAFALSESEIGLCAPPVTDAALEAIAKATGCTLIKTEHGYVALW